MAQSRNFSSAIHANEQLLMLQSGRDLDMWTQKKDEALLRLYEDMGEGCETVPWKGISLKMNKQFATTEFTGKKCRDRFNDQIDPTLEPSENVPMDLVFKFLEGYSGKNQFAEASRFIERATSRRFAANAIKNRYHSARRSKASRRGTQKNPTKDINNHKSGGNSGVEKAEAITERSADNISRSLKMKKQPRPSPSLKEPTLGPDQEDPILSQLYHVFLTHDNDLMELSDGANSGNCLESADEMAGGLDFNMTIDEASIYQCSMALIGSCSAPPSPTCSNASSLMPMASTGAEDQLIELEELCGYIAPAPEVEVIVDHDGQLIRDGQLDSLPDQFISQHPGTLPIVSRLTAEYTPQAATSKTQNLMYRMCKDEIDKVQHLGCEGSIKVIVRPGGVPETECGFLIIVNSLDQHTATVIGTNIYLAATSLHLCFPH